MARPHGTSTALGIGAAVACGWWATGLEPFSAPATLTVLAAGVVAMGVGGARRTAVHPRDVSVGAFVPWVVLGAALVAWQLAAYFQHPRADHPTLSSLTNAALDPRPIRVLAFAGWVLAAGWLARR